MVFHQDHDDYWEERTLLLLGEIMFACSYECLTKNVGESFMELPTKHVRDAVSKRTFSPQAIEFLKNTTGIKFLFTWATLTFGVHIIKEVTHSKFLQYWLPSLPPNGGFVKANRAMAIAGNRYLGFTNSIEKCPRQVLLETVVIPQLKNILQQVTVDPITREATWDEETEITVRDILSVIRGEHHSPYVAPENRALGCAAMPKANDLLDNLAMEEVLSWERITRASIDVYDPTWTTNNIDPAFTLEILPENPGAVRLMKTFAQKRILETLSFFKMYAEETNTTTRIRAVQAFQTVLDLMVASGNLDGSIAEEHRKMNLCFLMGTVRATKAKSKEHQKHSFYAARCRAMPKGYFVEAKSFGILSTVATRLGINSYCLLTICNELGTDLQNVWMQIEGMMGYGMARHGTPIQHDPQWKCPGPPAVGDLPSQPCMTPPERQQPNLIGSLTKRAINDIFVCGTCQKKVTLREREWLRANPDVNPERLQRLLQQQEDNRLCVLLEPEDRIEYNRDRVDRTTETREVRNNRKRNETRKRDADPNRPTKKKRSETFSRKKLTDTVLYPPYFQRLLSDAVAEFIRCYGQGEVFWNHILSLFEILLSREWTRLQRVMPNAGTYLVWDETYDRPKTYVVHAYRMAVMEHLDPPGTYMAEGVEKRSKNWIVRDYANRKSELKKTAKKLKDKALWDHVVDRVITVRPGCH